MIPWALLLFGGFLLGKPTKKNPHRMSAWTRLGSSGVLALAAWLWFGLSLNSPVRGYALLIALGMSLGFLGDLFMAKIIHVPNRVLAGMASFGLGHVLYIAALLGLGTSVMGIDKSLLWGSLLAFWLIAAAGWYALVFRGENASGLKWAALPYGLLLASTAGLAVGLALQSSGFIPLAIGAILFLLSDLILAAQLFNNLSFPLIDDIIWLTYGPGQMLIVYSIPTALAFAGV